MSRLLQIFPPNPRPRPIVAYVNCNLHLCTLRQKSPLFLTYHIYSTSDVLTTFRCEYTLLEKPMLI